VLSPDGTRIAYALGGIWVADTNGANATELIQGGTEIQPCWSPFSDQIAYSQDEALVIMNADGSNRHAVTLPVTSGVGCAWSPDGSTLAFEDALTHGIDVIGVNGTGLAPLRTVTANQEASFPHWASSGTQLIYQFIPQLGVPSQIYRISTTDTTAVNISNSATPVTSPFWVQ
jgi:Tol biopolymer transport system component